MPTFHKERFVSLREQFKYTQEDVAERVGVSKKQVSAWETGGAEPRTDNLVQLSRLFFVSVDYLLGVTDEPTGHGPDLDAQDRKILAIFRNLPKDLKDFILGQSGKK